MNDQLTDFFRLSAGLAVRLFPYVLLGILLTEPLKMKSWDRLLRRLCERQPKLAVFSASVLGAVSPLCTYGTMPVVLQLYRAGTPLAPLITFLAVSSLMNPQLFILTWRGIGGEMAFVRLGAVLFFGMLLGLAMMVIPQKWVVNLRIRLEEGGHETRRSRKVRGVKPFLRSFRSQFQFVGFFLLVGIIVGTALQVFAPQEWMNRAFDPDKWYSVPVAALLGVPLYACGGGAVPMIRGLMRIIGMGKGAALAYFLVGPETRITPLAAMDSVLRTGFIGLYVAGLFIFSLIVGFLYR